jgi:hypothetical protein
MALGRTILTKLSYSRIEDLPIIAPHGLLELLTTSRFDLSAAP